MPSKGAIATSMRVGGWAGFTVKDRAAQLVCLSDVIVYPERGGLEL